VCTLVSRCSEWLVKVDVGCFGEFGRLSLFEFVPPPSIEGVLLVASGIMSDDDGLLCWDVGGVLVGVSLWWILGVERGCF
jgi:hypothetical protein